MKRKSNLSRLLGYAGGFKYLSYTSWILSAVSALIALSPYYYIWLVMKEVLETAPDFGKAANLAHNGWMAVLTAVVAVLVYIAALMCSHLSAFRIATNLRLIMMEYIVKLPLGAAESFGSGKLRRIVNDSSAATETYLAYQLPDRYGALTTPVGLLFLLLVFDWRLGLLSLVPVLLAFLVMIKMTGKRMAEKMKQYQDSLDSMSKEAVEYVRGMPVVKTFGQTIFSFRKFKDSIDSYGKWVSAYTKECRLPMLCYTVAINSVFVFLILGALVITRGGIEGEFILNMIFYIIITPIISVTLTKIMYQSENAMIVSDALSRMDTLLNMNVLEETKAPEYPKDSSIDIENISFSYDGKNDVLKNISISIPSGSTVALVGPSGGGKTTLANIISRFFDPQKGCVKIGGVDVRNIRKEDLMSTVSFVFQNSHLLKASILDNVRMGKPTATREEVLSALEKAQCSDIIEKLPNGIDTVIGSRGVYLSGGEMQRLAIARTILKNAPIIILDEATAFADPDNENRVQQAFSNLSKGKTVIMIAHRLTTIANVDRIYVLKDGEIAESGTSLDLMKQNGIFSKMWRDYQSSVEWKVSKEAIND